MARTKTKWVLMTPFLLSAAACGGGAGGTAQAGG